MALKGGDLLHVGNTVLIDRIQSAGPGSLNIPSERVFELGNYSSVATIYDTPDLSFSMESFDVSAEVEAMLVGLGSGFGAASAGTKYELSKCRPIDVAGEFKRGKLDANLYDVAGSVVVPYLYLESMSYRFGIRDNARQTATLRGDSIFYAAASAYILEVAGTNAASQVIHFSSTGAVVGGGVTAVAPIEYNGDVVSGTRYALSVTNATTGVRLLLGTDYTETATGVTILVAVPVIQKIRIVWQSAVTANYPQVSHALESATRPAAIRGKHIRVFVGGDDDADEWGSVQAATVDWRVTLDKDEEFGNPFVVAQDFDVPEVSGSIDIKPRNVAEFMTRLEGISGTAPGEVVGPTVAAAVPLYIKLYSPTDGTVIKTLEVPDARFTVPGYSGQVQNKLVVSVPFSSNGGSLNVYKGNYDAP